MCQALSGLNQLVFPIVLQVGIVIPTLQMRKLRLGEESSDLRPPSQEVIEQDSDLSPGLLKVVCRCQVRTTSGGNRNKAKRQRLWPLAESMPGSSQAFIGLVLRWLELQKHLDNTCYPVLGAGCGAGLRRECRCWFLWQPQEHHSTDGEAEAQ